MKKQTKIWIGAGLAIAAMLVYFSMKGKAIRTAAAVNKR